MSEQELVNKLRSGDRIAFKELFETYHAMAFNICLRMLGNRQEAEDLTQDVFFKAFKSLKHFRAESKLSTWLYRIAVNLCLNHQRRKKIERWISLDFIFESQDERGPSHMAASEDGPDKMLEKNEMECIIQNAINSLPKPQRIALVLHRYEELSYQEIAEVMNCSVPCVESRLHRAKQNLYERLLPFIQEL